MRRGPAPCEHEPDSDAVSRLASAVPGLWEVEASSCRKAIPERGSPLRIEASALLVGPPEDDVGK